jgi:enoyl-CoA hydratase
MQPELLYEQTDGIATITINRPWVKNSFTVAMWAQLHALVDQIRADQNLRLLILQGAGDDAFTSGSDISEFARMDVSAVDAGFQVMEDAISAVESLPIPTIASLNGYALGGGLELALACDLRIASERATLGMPIARLGIMISPRFAKRITDLIGPSRAKDMLYTGRFIAADEALRMGLINYFVLSHELRKTTREMARRIASFSQPSIAAAKRAVELCVPFSAAAEDQGPYFIDPHDFPEGVAAFLEKRAPNFRKQTGGQPNA